MPLAREPGKHYGFSPALALLNHRGCSHPRHPAARLLQALHLEPRPARAEAQPLPPSAVHTLQSAPARLQGALSHFQLQPPILIALGAPLQQQAEVRVSIYTLHISVQQSCATTFSCNTVERKYIILSPTSICSESTTPYSSKHEGHSRKWFTSSVKVARGPSDWLQHDKFFVIDSDWELWNIWSCSKYRKSHPLSSGRPQFA